MDYFTKSQAAVDVSANNDNRTAADEFKKFYDKKILKLASSTAKSMDRMRPIQTSQYLRDVEATAWVTVELTTIIQVSTENVHTILYAC